MKSTLDTVAFFKTLRETLESMSDEDAGALIKALFAHDDGEDPDLSEKSVIVRVVFPLVAEPTDRLTKIRMSKVRTAANEPQTDLTESAPAPQSDRKPSYHNHSHNHNQSHNHTSSEEDGKVRRFTPPTAEQVNEYATKFGMKIDAQRFVDFYSSKGWKVGSSPMKDWQAAVRNWVSRDKKGKKDDKSDLINQLIARTYGEAST
jgi:hypothetical protein